MTKIYISSLTDLRDAVERRLGRDDLADVVSAMTEDLLQGDHPPWGTDWAEYITDSLWEWEESVE